MTNDLNGDSGKISGKKRNISETQGKIAGGAKKNDNTGVKIAETQDQKTISTRKGRISFATTEKGLKTLPEQFGDSDGDWQIIESDNLFEVLFLDYSQIIAIIPEVVQNNHRIILEFWKEKKNLWESGSGQVRESIAVKYGEKNLDNCIKKLDYALEQLSSIQKINEYYNKLKEQRIKIAESKLETLFKMMLKDGEAEPGEMEDIFEDGLRNGFSDEEIAFLIKKELDSKQYVPFGEPSGEGLKPQLLSVTWMTPEKKEKRIREGKEIFDNIFAYKVEDIGEIFYNNEEKARLYINKGLVANAVNAFSIPKAEYILEVSKSQTDEYLKYLKIIYRLNPKLPFRFLKKQSSEVSELCSFIAENNESLKMGKEHFKKGNIETWLQETHKEDYRKFIEIRDAAENGDLAFLEFIHTFNKTLPYRFAGKFFVNTPGELYLEIDKNKENWNAGKNELFNSSILIWLKTRGHYAIIENWDKIKKEYSADENVGLENFLHLLNDTLVYPTIKLKPVQIDVQGIQIGKSQSVDILIDNGTRGYLRCDLNLTENIKGVSLSKEQIFSTPLWQDKMQKVVLNIDSTDLIKGKLYKSNINIKNNVGDPIRIPLTFKVIFPSTALIRELIKYAIFFTLLGIYFRGLFFVIGAGNWLNSTFSYYIQYKDISWNKTDLLTRMPILFFLLIGGVFFLLKYWKRIGKFLQRIK